MSGSFEGSFDAWALRFLASSRKVSCFPAEYRSIPLAHGLLSLPMSWRLPARSRILAAVFATIFHVPSAVAQQAAASAQPAVTSSQELNIRACVELLRSDVRTKKTAILTQIMQLDDDQATKFWPIYREYDFELQKLNDQKLAGIRDYAKNHDSMTDQKADQLAQLALDLESKRNDLKKTYYERVCFRKELL